MDLSFDKSLALKYSSQSQKIRVLSESWIKDNLYCPCCGRKKITQLPNNKPVADFYCESCNEIFEVKSKKGQVGTRIVDGAYHTAIERIESSTNPELLVLQYSNDMHVDNLILIPKFFFTPNIIEKRNPLGANAQRAGWIGSNILFGSIPEQGKIHIVRNSKEEDKEKVLHLYAESKRFIVDDIANRSWLLDVLMCVNRLQDNYFTLQKIYEFSDKLKKLHPNNNHIEAKIRQQLQLLRDRGFIKFLGNGEYLFIFKKQ